MALWGGRFREQTDGQFAAFSSSFPYDRRLLPYDVKGSTAWAFALARGGVLSVEETRQIARGLRAVQKQAPRDSDWLEGAGFEDVHSYVEARLYDEVGEVAGKLHTGRSRNDQVVLDLRLYVKDVCRVLHGAVLDLSFELLRLGQRHPEVALPGYTHLRRAQPILWAHYCLAYVEMLLRDAQRLRDCYLRADVLPLGSGALAGTSFPIDRQRLARALGFREVSENSLDAVSDRDFVLDPLSAASILGVHLSRLAEDWILYSSTEFGFLEIADQVSTGSSLMPQKKNPDALELIRGKSGRLSGNLTSVLSMLKGLPMAYNRDLQEDKEPLFDSMDTALACLQVMRTVTGSLELHPERTHGAAQGDFSTATDLADYLVQKGVPFRQAHHLVGQVVLMCIEEGATLSSLPLERYRELAPVFDQDLFDSVSVENSLAARAVQGGTAPVVVSVALGRTEKRLLKVRALMHATGS